MVFAGKALRWCLRVHLVRWAPVLEDLLLLESLLCELGPVGELCQAQLLLDDWLGLSRFWSLLKMLLCWQLYELALRSEVTLSFWHIESVLLVVINAFVIVVFLVERHSVGFFIIEVGCFVQL